MEVTWTGVFPATTTQFRADQTLDLEATQQHLRRLIECEVDGLIVLGTLGENTALEPDEKRAVLKAALEAAEGRVPVLAGIAECSTALACRFAADAQALGADGLMVLPAMVYRSDGRETVEHFRAVARASALPILCYNNPVAYGVDVTPEMFAELADEETLLAIKESSDDPRRITDIVNVCGARYRLFCGVDDLVLESALLGAVGWVAGLVNAFPEDCVRLWRLAAEGRYGEARELYRRLMPVLHLDSRAKLVQCVKLAQALAGLGVETVRAPRLPLDGEERRQVAAVVQAALDSRAEAAE